MKRLSFVILSYKSREHLRICLRNIYRLQFPFEYEVIVVDNASGDGAGEMVSTLYPQATLIENERNLGHPAGNNVGLRVAQGEYIIMINPDIIIRDAQEVVKIVEYMDANERVAFLGPRLHNTDGTIQYSCYRPYSRWTPVYRRTFLGKFPFAKNDIERHLMVDFDHNSTIEVKWLLGAFMVIRKKAMDDIGLMDERLFVYCGDYEWCDRAWKKNWKVVYYHDVDSIFHYHKRESASSRFSFLQLFSYITRIHIRDLITYNKIKPYA